MPTIGTPFTPTANKVLLCGAGELGKEVVIELKMPRRPGRRL
jgi:phosphoribosylglycinamide formyltransferase 2